MNNGTCGESDIAMEAAKLLSQLSELGSTVEMKAHRREKFDTVGDRLCDLYLEADKPTKEAIRRLAAERPSEQDALLYFVHSCAARIAKGPDSDAVANTQRALAAASIENLGTEWRDTHVALREVYEAARKAGVNAEQYFREAADYSSDRSPHPQIADHPSMRVFLERLVKQFLREIEEGQGQGCVTFIFFFGYSIFVFFLFLILFLSSF